ncbi:Uncharacterized protein Rs2_01875 [Raphanus sativus]|nr:Uncharacterized protein Rs2_01875 [Raphanus sativus]
MLIPGLFTSCSYFFSCGLVFLQSFGGFCALTYLSFAPQELKQVLITGGIPPIVKACTADDVYDAGFEQVIRQNDKYYKRFPEDIEIVRELVNYLAESEGGGDQVLVLSACITCWREYGILF